MCTLCDPSVFGSTGECPTCGQQERGDRQPTSHYNRSTRENADFQELLSFGCINGQHADSATPIRRSRDDSYTGWQNQDNEGNISRDGEIFLWKGKKRESDTDR